MTDDSFSDSDTCTPDTTDIDRNSLTLETCYVDNKRKLGSGSHGEVLVGIAAIGRLKMELAVKRVNISGANEDTNKAVKCLRNEIDIMKRLKHKNIVQFYGADEDIDYLCIFMEPMPLGSVKDYMVKSRCALTEDITATYTYQALEGIVFLHKNEVVHRDIKCANILLQNDNIVKLSDFGVSKEMDNIQSTLNSFVGTPKWMAPEQIKRKYKQKIDIWALGCTVVEMLTGEPPWSGRDGISFFYQLGEGYYPEYQLPKETSKDIHEFLVAAFKADPKDRPSAMELLHHPFIARDLSERETKAGMNRTQSPSEVDDTDMKRNAEQEDRSPRLIFEKVQFNSNCFPAYSALRPKLAPISKDLDIHVSNCGIRKVRSTLQEIEENEWFSKKHHEVLTVAYTESIQHSCPSKQYTFIDRFTDEGRNIVREENASPMSMSLCEIKEMFGNEPAPTVIVACLKEQSIIAQHIHTNSRMFIVLITDSCDVDFDPGDIDLQKKLRFKQGNFVRQTMSSNFLEVLDDLFEMMIFDTIRAKVTLLTRLLSESETSNVLDRQRMWTVLTKSKHNPYLFVLEPTIGTKDQDYLYKIRSNEDNIRKVLYQAKALYKDSKVPVEAMPEFLEEIDKETTQKIKQELTPIKTIIGKTTRFGKFLIYIDEDVCDDTKEKTRLECEEVMKRHGILPHRYEFQYASRNFEKYSIARCGSRIGQDCYGTLGGFAHCVNKQGLYALTTRHIKQQGQQRQQDNSLFCDGRKIGTYLETRSVDIDIAIARIDDNLLHMCDTRFLNNSGEPKACRVNRNKLHSGQSAHIWGAFSSPGRGVISGIDFDFGLGDWTVEQSQYIVVESKAYEEPFCRPGDSGAIILIEGRRGELCAVGMLIGMLMTREADETGTYIGLKLKDGLDELSRAQASIFQLVGGVECPYFAHSGTDSGVEGTDDNRPGTDNEVEGPYVARPGTDSGVEGSDVARTETDSGISVCAGVAVMTDIKEEMGGAKKDLETEDPIREKSMSSLPAIPTSKSTGSLPEKLSLPDIPIVFVMGSPGSSKKSQVELLLSRYAGWKHLSVGKLIKEEIKRHGDAQKKWKLTLDLLSNGEAAPEEVTIEVVIEALKNCGSAKGIVMTGFPRNMSQVNDYARAVSRVDVVFMIACDEDKAMDKMIRKGSNSSRPEYSMSALTNKMNYYKAYTLETAKYFDDQGKLIVIDGDTDDANFKFELGKKFDDMFYSQYGTTPLGIPCSEK